MPPQHEELDRLIGTAIVDREFRANLLASPASAASEFTLSSEELDALSSASAESLEELATHLYAWITRASPLQRASSARPALEGYRTIRMAV